MSTSIDGQTIESDGPRRIVHLPVTGRFGVACTDCGWFVRFDHRHDAQDALDAHRCESRP